MEGIAVGEERFGDDVGGIARADELVEFLAVNPGLAGATFEVDDHP